MIIDFSGKVVLVTGATGQLGRVMVRTFAGSGANVVIHYHRNEERARALRAEVEALGVRAMIVQADVSDEGSVRRMRDEVERALGMPHIVVDNAVSQYRWASILEQPPSDFRDQFETCVLHNVLMAQAFLPAMIERGWGRLVGINTECAGLCNENSGAYVAGKRGMDGLYRVLAKEVGRHGVTVNQVAPGWTISEKDRAEGGVEPSPAYDAKVPLGRRGTDQEIANAVAFLASDLASFTTGAYLPVCGGSVMPGI